MPFAAIWMVIMERLSYKVKLSQKKTHTIWYHLYEESKTNGTNELTYKAEIDSQTNSRLPKRTVGIRGWWCRYFFLFMAK